MPPLPSLKAAALADAQITHGFFTRQGGVSTGAYASLNCGPGSQDQLQNVQENKKRCQHALGADHLVTLYQIHSAKAVFLKAPPKELPQADAMVTNMPGLALGILTADCMPVLFHDRAAGLIGAAHAGWKGALGGVLENTVALMREHGANPQRIKVAIGPCLQQENFEVGFDLIEAFASNYNDMERFLRPGKTPDKRQLDLVAFGKWRLAEAGIVLQNITALPDCTMAAPEQFFSYRQMKKTGGEDYGRNLSGIVLNARTQ